MSETGWFPFLFYSTTWVGEVYLRYDAPAEAKVAGDLTGQVGRIGSMALIADSSALIRQRKCLAGKRKFCFITGLSEGTLAVRGRQLGCGLAVEIRRVRGTPNLANDMRSKTVARTSARHRPPGSGQLSPNCRCIRHHLHLLSFVNLTHTSIVPPKHRASSRRAREYLVLASSTRNQPPFPHN